MPRYLLTGAGSGIGAATARLLHGRGDALVLLARSTGRAEELRASFPGARAVVADLARPAAAYRALMAPGALPDSLDGVVHAAGVVRLAPVEATLPDDVAEQLAVNLHAPMLLTSALLAAVRRGAGTHVFVNSTAGLTANAGWSAYAAGKWGLRGFADALRAEEAEHGVRVSTVFPGRTATPMQAEVHRAEGRGYDPDRWIRPETVAAEIVRVLDLPPDATVAELVLRPR